MCTPSWFFSGPRPGLQSEVDCDEAHHWAAFYFERVGAPSQVAARSARDALLRNGVRILSLGKC